VEGLHAVGGILSKISINCVLIYMLCIYTCVYVYGFFQCMMHVYFYCYFRTFMGIYPEYLYMFISLYTVHKFSIV
jgi:hypothetical protein